MNAIPKLDLEHTWHPCSQMKDYEDFAPIHITKATGPFLITNDGKKVIDAISSWWCKSLGHAHPVIKEAVLSQMDKFEHVILANTCNETVANLSAKLATLCPPLDRIFYADNGSTAMEIAMKMSLQYHAQTGNPERNSFAALVNGYHGETILTLAAGDCELYSKPYAPIMPKIAKIGPFPCVTGENDPNWVEVDEKNWQNVEKQLEPMASSLSAILFEPVVQGAGGMIIYSPDWLRRLRRWADKHDIHLIADEIMTGFGRTGKALACEHAGITPDFIALSKGLTAGWGPMSAVLCSTQTYEAFYDDYATGKAFMHSNTYTGFALSAAAALTALNIYEQEDIYGQVTMKSAQLRKRMEDVANSTGALTNIRSLGYVVAADLFNPDTGAPFPSKDRTGYQCYKKAVELGALLRPLGDTIYFFPPLNTPDDVLDNLAEIAAKAISQTIKP